MHIGYQFLAPEGFESLPRGFRYYVAHVSKEGALVLWVAKSVGQRRRVCWLRMSRSVLAAELTSDHGVLVPCEPQLNLPEWLQSQAGLDMEALEEFRPGRPKRPYRELVEQRYREIAPAIERWPEV